MTQSRSIEEVDRNFVKPRAADGLLWHDIRGMQIEGRGWPATELVTPFDRLPARAEKLVRKDVWWLAQHCTGFFVRFSTDALQIAARWKLRMPDLAMPHMPATGVSGLDLYLRERGTWRWIGQGRPAAVENSLTLVTLHPSTTGPREFMLYLPLYNGVESVEIGVPEGASFSAAPVWPGSGKPILFYGTSITQGGCAARPGMAYPAIIGRWLDRPTINLGFSGNGPMELEIARLIAELDPSVYVLDCIPNMGPQHVPERAEPFVNILRKAHPTTPIVIVEGIVYQSNMIDTPQPMHVEKNALLRAAYGRMLAAGVTGLHYVPGDGLLGYDHEGTVDGCHPTDVGFIRIAEALTPVLRPLV